MPEEDLALLLAKRLSQYTDWDVVPIVPKAIKNAKHYTVRKILVEDLCAYKDQTRNACADSIAYVPEDELQLLLANRLSQYNDTHAKDLLPKAIKNATYYSVRKVLVNDLCAYGPGGKKKSEGIRTAVTDSFPYVEEDLQLLLAKQLIKYNDKEARSALLKIIPKAKSSTVQKLLVEDFCRYSNVSIATLSSLVLSITDAEIKKIIVHRMAVSNEVQENMDKVIKFMDYDVQ
ncbi:MAG: hypothetical protein WCG98_01370 [bacterium]